MLSNDGIVISDTEPTVLDKVTWLQILADGSRKWFQRVGNEWELVKDESAPVNDIATLLNNGITGSKTLGGYKLTFNHGVLVGFEQA